MLRRGVIVGHPHIYALEVGCVLDQPLLGDEGEADALLGEFERVRRAFDARCFAFAVTARSLHLIVGHRTELHEDDAALMERWRGAGGADLEPRRLTARLTTLSGLMQTLLQRYSKARNRRRGGRGAMWASRYRACLLADDPALLAATAWIERGVEDAIASSRGRHDRDPDPIALAPPPLALGPGGLLLPAEDAPPGLTPPAQGERQAWLDRFADGLGEHVIGAYGDALRRGWALGRPESLAEALARLGRPGGRGRGRVARELADDLGLCGVWG